MKYCFYAKKDINYSKYGFIHEDNEWVIWRGTRRISIDEKRNNYMSFNMITNEILKIFMQLIKDDLIIFKEKPDQREPRYHYIGLTEEEYELIQRRRNGE